MIPVLVGVDESTRSAVRTKTESTNSEFFLHEQGPSRFRIEFVGGKAKLQVSGLRDGVPFEDFEGDLAAITLDRFLFHGCKNL